MPGSQSPHPADTSRRAFVFGAAALAAMSVTDGCSSDDRSSPTTTGRRDSRPGGSTSTTATPATTTPGSPARFVSHGPTDAPRVALTFHTDGDLTLAHALLDVLAAHHTKVTTFVVGKWLDANPDWGHRLVDGGHELANHTYHHLTFAKLPPAEMATEITRCRDVLSRLGGTPGDFFRPSGTENGIDSPNAAVLAAAGAAGYSTVLGYDLDPTDYRDPGAAAVQQRVEAGLHPGAILSLHFGHRGTIDALPAIISAISARGLSIVTAGELLQP